ncbi:MAG: hypothetical protein K2K45_00135 [Muribaculaceae bacterium]|nr:hypothetical protein [Muribaculaceae bacterium]
MYNNSLTGMFDMLLSCNTENPEIKKNLFDMVYESPESGERDGLLALIYHEGIGVKPDMDKCFEYAEKAAFSGDDPLGYYILGYMCDNAETPDQKSGGPRQKYDHYDAESFYESCAKKESIWKIPACNWLGDYFTDFAKGGDPETGVEYYEEIAEEDAEAAGKLSDYYWDLVMPDHTDDTDRALQLFKWTSVAAKLDPKEYAYRLGWLYADGIGCSKTHQLAIKYFNDAFLHDDWRGACSIAHILESYIDQHKDMDDKERNAVRHMISSWKILAKEKKEENDSEEHDYSQEED